MIRLLRFLVTGYWDEPPHEHDWVVAREDHVKNGCLRIGSIFIMKCRICGEMKEFKSML